MNAIDKLKEIYDKLETNIVIKSFWDAGYEGFIGDQINGMTLVYDGDDIEACIEALHEEATRREQQRTAGEN